MPHRLLSGGVGATAPSDGAVPWESYRALVVAREPRREVLTTSLRAQGLQVVSAPQVENASALVVSSQPHLVLLDEDPTLADIAMALAALREREPFLMVLVAACVEGDTVTRALQWDVDTVLREPIDRVSLLRVLRRRHSPLYPSRALQPTVPSLVVGGSDAMKAVWSNVIMAASGDASVLVRGETGTGKEVIARALHRFSDRRHGPFVALNCAAVPEPLLESELLGYEKGAFTGATGRHKGRFELAHQGTLFLDEIGDMPPGLQAKLLRVLQEQTFERLGGSESVCVDVRIIAATHYDLEQAAHEGRFRLDLLYRLNVITIAIPPLREHKGDILPLWTHHTRVGAQKEGRTPPVTTPELQRALIRHNWPGNIRELENVAQHLLTVTTSDVLGVDDLPKAFGGCAIPEPVSGLRVGTTIAEAERDLILLTYDALGSVGATAETLGISPRTLHYRLREYEKQGVLEGKRRRGRAEVGLRRPRDLTRHVLLAEDDDDLRWLLNECLRDQGYTVTTVRDGSAVLEYLAPGDSANERTRPDVIVTDLRMPGLTGLQLLEAVRAGGSRVPILLMSAFGDPEIRERAEHLGASAFLDKPVEPTALGKAIRAALVN